MRLNGRHSTYSFADVVFTLNSGVSVPGFSKSHEITGEGVGSITVTRGLDNSQHDVAADGSVMTSKIIARNGAIAISVQQTSKANRFLTTWYNQLYNSPTSKWTDNNASLIINEKGTTMTFEGVCPQKRPDLAHQAQGQQITWNLLTHEINEE